MGEPLPTPPPVPTLETASQVRRYVEDLTQYLARLRQALERIPGDVKLSGALVFVGTQIATGSSTATFTATNKPGATSGVGPNGWLEVTDSAGVARLIPCWPK